MSHRTLFRSDQFNGLWAGMEDVSADTVLVRNFTCRRQGPAARPIVLYVYPCPTARFSPPLFLSSLFPPQPSSTHKISRPPRPWVGIAGTPMASPSMKQIGR